MRKWIWIFLLLLLARPAHAQEAKYSASSREVLLYRKPAGEYLVTIEGERILGRAYMDVRVTLPDGQPAPADTQVRITTVAGTVEIVNGGQEFIATSLGNGVFRIDPLSFDQDGRWTVGVALSGPAGVASTSFTTRVYPANPGVPLWFSIVSLALPVVVAGSVLAWRRRSLLRTA